MRQRTLRQVVWVAVLSAGLALPLLAQPGGRGERGRDGVSSHRGPDHNGARLVEFLELTEDQREAWRAAHEAHRLAVEPILEEVRENREALRAAIDTKDALAIGNAVLAGEVLRDDLKATYENLEAELIAVLDADQVAKYEAFKAARGGGRGRLGRPGHVGMGPGPGALEDGPGARPGRR